MFSSHCARLTELLRRTPLVNVNAGAGRIVAATSRFRHQPASSLLPTSVNRLKDTAGRGSEFSQDQTSVDPSLAPPGPPRVRRSSKPCGCLPIPLPTDQLLMKLNERLTLPPLNRRSPS